MTLTPFKKGILILTLLLVALSPVSFAGNQGHYYPGVTAIRDVVQPPKGVYFAQYDPYYHAGVFKDANGNDLDHISKSGSLTQNINIGGPLGGGINVPVTLSGTFDVDIDTQVDMVIQQPSFLWSTGLKILGFNHATLLAVPFGYTRIDIKAQADAAGTISLGNILNRAVTASQTVEIKDDKYGMGDLYFVPVWLAKTGKRYDAGVNYGFFAPTGAYDEGDIANVGFGFWTHQWQANGVYYLNDIKATGLMLNTTYELHSYNYQKDVRPGQNFTLEYGLSQYLHERVEIGVASSHQWQISEDAGEQAVNKGVKDRINAVGGQLTLWPMKGKLMVVGKCNWEYGGVDRPEGLMSSVNITWIFGEPIMEKLKKIS